MQQIHDVKHRTRLACEHGTQSNEGDFAVPDA